MVTPTSGTSHERRPALAHHLEGALAWGRATGGTATHTMMAAALVVTLGTTGCDEQRTGALGSPSSSVAARPNPVLSAARPSASLALPAAVLPAGDLALTVGRADALVRTGRTRIELISAGEPPRRRLRHPTGQAEGGQLVVTAQIAVTVHEPGQAPVAPPVPPLRVVLDLKLTPAEGDRASLSFAIAEAGVTPTDEAEQAVAAEMAPALAGLRGMEGEFQLTPQGLAVGTAQPNQRTSPELLQLWTTVGEAVRDLVIPYPEAEVGLGAQWRVLDRVRRAGMGMVRRSTVRVVTLSDSSITLAAEVREVAIASSARPDPALPADTVVEVVRGDSTGNRAIRGPLGRLLPRDGESKLLGKLTMDIRPPPELAPAEAARRSTVQLHQTLRVTLLLQ